MLHTRKVLVIAAVSVIGLASLAAAQMMGSHSSHMPMGQNDTTSQSATMGMGMGYMNMSMDSLVTNMSENYSTMSQDLDSLQTRVEGMMKDNDLHELRVEMQKELDIVNDMCRDLGRQQSIYDRMLLMMKNGNTSGGIGMINWTMSKTHKQMHN